MTDHPDTQAIQAVRDGDIERFRELIDRYERQVYAVAWARLGDPSLAEDAVQESFIRAFRLLSWLRNPERFAAWITRIARAVAINLGIRNRRELRRRERWALDHARSEPPMDTASAQEPPIPPDTLRAALADLPHRHRECLILFYLEGRPITEAAAALGISESAFKVRLHRARHVLRGQLERHLEASLGQLTPRRSLAPGIMSSIALKAAASDPAGAGTGLLAFVGTAFAKILPLPLLFLLIPVATVAVGVGARSWATRAEQRNYLDPDGFRLRFYEDERTRTQNRGALWIALMVLPLALGVALPASLPYLILALAISILPILAAAIREFVLARHLSAAAASALLTTPLLVGFGVSSVWNLPPSWMGAVWGLYFLGLLVTPPLRRLRFDENLFLRERLGLLKVQTIAGPSETTRPATLLPTPSASDLWHFARLGAREGLFVGWRRSRSGLRLGLRPVCSSWHDDLGHRLWNDSSQVVFGSDGSIQATLGPRDASHLDRLGIPPSRSTEEARAVVQEALRHAFEAHRQGQPTQALQHLGQVPEATIFASNPSRTGHARVQRIAGVLGLIYAALLLLQPWLAGSRSSFVQTREAGFESVDLSPDQARKLFESFGATNTNSRHRWDGLSGALYRGHLLPPFEWVGPQAREFLQTKGAQSQIDHLLRNPDRLLECLQDWRALKALSFHWDAPPTASLLQSAGPRLRDALAAIPAEDRAALLQPDVGRVLNADFSFLDLTPIRWRIAGLKHLGILDAFDTRPLVALIHSHQVLPGHPLPEGRNPHLDTLLWRGLFAFQGFDPIEETFLALAILNDLDSVSTIDQEACIQGILSFHLGRGLFDARPDWDRPFSRKRPPGAPKIALQIPGDARTTYAARESLRILHALNRVPDLAHWQYRVAKGSLSESIPAALRDNARWSVVEAFLLQNHAPPVDTP